MKNMKKLAALLLTLVLVLSMTACGGDQSKIVGVWETEVEFAPIFNDTLGDHEGAQYLKVESLKLKLTMTFHDDDTYSVVSDAASVNAAMKELRKTLRSGMEKYLVETIAASGLDLELGDILHMLNTDMDSLIDEVLTPDLMENLAARMAAKGQYLAEEGKLYLSDSVDKEIDETVYDTYVLSENTLSLVTPSQTDAYTELLYPLVFSRVNE